MQPVEEPEDAVGIHAWTPTVAERTPESTGDGPLASLIRSGRELRKATAELEQRANESTNDPATEEGDDGPD